MTWSDCISSKPKLFISKNKQQETLHQQQAAGEAKHSAENTINFSLCVCVRSRSRGVRAPSPPRVGVARTPRAVPVLGAGRAVPRGPCPSACPASVPCSVWLALGGGGPVPFPPTWVGASRSPWDRCGCGDPSPTPPRALLRAGFARCGAAGGCPGGAPLAWVWGVRGRTLSRPRPLVLSGVRPGPTTDWLWVRGVRAWGPVNNPTAHALASWLCALWGRHKGARGGCLLPGCGASGVGHSPTPGHSSFRVCGRGPLTTGRGCGGCGRGDPSPTPARALLRAGFARCGGGTRVPWGGRLLPGCGPSGVWRSLDPDCPSFGACGRRPLPTGCGCGACGRGDPSSTPHRALLRAGLARCGGGTRAPGGGAFCLGVGRPGSGALPAPTTLPFGRAAGAHYPLAVGAGDAGVGTGHQPHSARSCELALRAVGAARGRPGGAPLAWVWGCKCG